MQERLGLFGMGRNYIMGKSSSFDKKSIKIIDTVEYNGRYTDVSTVRTRLIVAGIILIGAAALICVQLFWL